MSYGSFEFLATGCQHGVTISAAYPQALPYGVRFMKFGPPSFGAPNEWMDWASKVQLSADPPHGDLFRAGQRRGRLRRAWADRRPDRPGWPERAWHPGGWLIPTLGEWALALLRKRCWACWAGARRAPKTA